MSIETMIKLATVTVGVGGSATIDFSNIPQTYTDLVLKTSLRGSTNNSGNTLGLYIKINNSTSNLSWKSVGNSNGSAFSQGNTTNYTRTSINDTGSTASTFSNAEFYFSSYTSSNYKSFSIDSIVETNSTSPVDLELVSFLWSNTAAITQITLTPESPLFAEFSTATLYGVRNAAKTAGNSIKATGGNISFDGTYVYHVFPSTGTFTPTKILTADYLVVAGGGGGNHNVGGGGGGGGVVTYQGIYMSSSIYTVTVGAGGAAGTGATTYAGSASSIGSIGIANGGGAPNGVAPGGTGGNSGSGGYIGGSYYYPDPNGMAGGGGAGAGGNGTSASASYNPPNGGIGATSSLITGLASPIVAGELYNGNYYFGGGGGGGVSNGGGGWGNLYTGPGGSGGKGGGGAGNKTGSGYAGTANTGGGGGAGSWDNSGAGYAGAAGGSGLVIIRYKA